MESGDFPGGPVVRTPGFQVQEVWVPSLVGELRSHMLRGQNKIKNFFFKKKKKKKLPI